LKGTSPSITAFPLSILGGGDSGITGLTKMVLEVDRVSEIEVGTYPSPVFVSWALLNGEHMCELIV